MSMHASLAASLPPEIVAHIVALAGLDVCIALRHLPALQALLVSHVRRGDRSKRVEKAVCHALLNAKWSAGVQAFVEADLTVAGMSLWGSDHGDWSSVTLPPACVQTLVLRDGDHANIATVLVANLIAAGRQDDPLLQWCIERWNGFTRSLGFQLLKRGASLDQVRAVCQIAEPDITEKRLAEYFLYGAVELGQFDLVRYFDALCPELAQHSTTPLEQAIIGNHPDIARYLYDRIQVTDLSDAVCAAAVRNRIDIATWLYNTRPQPQEDQTLAQLARHGHADLLTQIWSDGHAWKTSSSWTLCSMVLNAVSGNHLNVLEWLMAVEPGCCTARMLTSVDANNISLATLKWVLEHASDRLDVHTFASITRSCKSDVAEWLMDAYPECNTVEAIKSALLRGNLDRAMVIADCLEERLDVITLPASTLGAWWNCMTPKQSQWLDTHCRFINIQESLKEAVEMGSLGFSKLLRKRFPDDAEITSALFSAACTTGNLALVQWMYQLLDPTDPSPDPLDEAAAAGRMQMVQWLHNHTALPCTTKAMDGAAKAGRLDIVCYLHENRSEGCTTAAMDGAATEGHMNVLEWLHENRCEGCSTQGLAGAAAKGQTLAVRWLLKHYPSSLGPEVLDAAALGGYMDVIKLLHSEFHAPCTTNAMDYAACQGNLQVVQWLHENRTEGCTEAAMQRALRFGATYVAQFLLDHGYPTCRFDRFEYDDLPAHSQRWVGPFEDDQPIE
ncbi:hypothetical protein RI367_001584 [Sorochytrium milnesiophthora]